MFDLATVTPRDLGLPAKFADYRRAQREILGFILHGDPSRAEGRRRFMCAGAPTGIGKTLIHQSIHRITNEKVVSLTATRALQDQAMSDGFPGVDIRGRANYQCEYHSPFSSERWSCDEGDEKGCPFAASGQCTYMRQSEAARQSMNVRTNYAYWMHARSAGRFALELPSRNPIRWLVLDEAALAFNELSKFLSVWIGQRDLQEYGGPDAPALFRMALRHPERWAYVDSDWQALAATIVRNADARMAGILEQCNGSMREARGDKEYRRAGRLAKDLSRVARHGTDSYHGRGVWLWRSTIQEGSGRAGMGFDCVWPARYAEQYLFHGIPNVVLISATLRPKLMELLGIKRSEYEFKEWPRQFTRSKAPVYFCPVGKMGKKEGDAALERAVGALDAWLETRLDRRAVVHTASYTRAEQVQSRSKYGRFMVLNKNANEAPAVVERFRNSPPPVILVSPSYGTGYDLAADACELNIVLKLPFSDRSQPITQARSDDSEFEAYQVAQSVVQAAGRGDRFDGDRCETVILDSAWNWIQYAGREFIPNWFRTRKTSPEDLPGAPAAMERTRCA